jgi:hypothetical protein
MYAPQDTQRYWKLAAAAAVYQLALRLRHNVELNCNSAITPHDAVLIRGGCDAGADRTHAHDGHFCVGAGTDRETGWRLRAHLFLRAAGPIDGDGPQEKQVVSKLILPASALADALLLLAHAARDVDGVVTALATDMVH